MTTQHTPGPWTTDGSAHSGDLDVISPAGRITLIDCEFSDESEDVLTANARLIAAAPDLLAALMDVLDADGDLDAMDFNRYRAAIAKATGAT
jgi:ABC-type branched-subunit amino acid transport system substrate-binding protein